MVSVKKYTDEQLHAKKLRTERERRRRTREAAENHRRPWTEAEVEALVAMEGMPMEEIARRLGRSYTAVENKRRWLSRERAMEAVFRERGLL